MNRHAQRPPAPKRKDAQARRCGTSGHPARSLITTSLISAMALAGASGVGGLGGCAGSRAASRNSTPAPVQPMEAADRHLAAAEQAARDGDQQRALALFQRAIEINPTLTRAQMGMADIYRMEGDYAKAEGRYRRVTELEPQNFDGQYYLGLVLHLLDRVPEAIRSYLRALTIRPRDFRTNLNLASAYYQLDENTQALPYGEQAVQLEPQNADARFNLGAIYAALGRHREAVKEYQQAAELMELTPELLLNLAESLGKLDRYDEMSNALETLIRTSPSAAAYERLGYARFKMGKYEEARERFEQSIAVEPDYYPAHNGLGVCLLNTWLWSDKRDMAARDRGIASLRKSLQIERNQPQIVDLLSRYGR